MKKKAKGRLGQISWVYTANLQETALFYSSILGLECSRDEGSARIFEITDGAFIGLCEVFGDRVVQPEGHMISILTDDVDGWYGRLLERGVDIDEPPHRLDQFGIYTFFVRDPNGYIIEFQQFLRRA